jgi:hypothetical protein
MGAVIALSFELPPDETKMVPFALACDQPVMDFGGGRHWYPR